jgi:hypothetical protein
MIRLALVASVVMFATPAAADPKSGVIFVGGSAADGGGAYAGALIAFPGDTLGKGWALKAAVAGGAYDYVSGGIDIDARYVSGAVALVRQYSWAEGWANFSLGGRLADTSLSPGDPGNERAGRRADATLGTDGAILVGPWRLGWYADAGLRDEAYLFRASAARTLGRSSLSIGAEALRQGDPSYATTRAGALARWRVNGGAEIEVSAGAEFERAALRPYVGLSTSILI